MKTFLFAVLIAAIAGGAAAVHKTLIAAKPLVLDIPMVDSPDAAPPEDDAAAGEPVSTPDSADAGADEPVADAGADAAEGRADAGGSEGDGDSAEEDSARAIGLEEAVELYELAMAGEATIIDARPPRLYEQGHIPMSINLPLTSFSRGDLPEELMYILPDKPIMIYCTGEDCDESKNVAYWLTQVGDYSYGQMRIFTGGWPAWEGAGHEVETGPGQW